MTYEYYVRLFKPGMDPEQPMGVYRAPNGNVFRIEVFRRDFKWHYSEDVSRKFFNGDTIDIEQVSRETARKALQNITGKKEDFTDA